MKKITKTLRGLAQGAIKPFLTAAGAIGGHQVGTFAAGYAPRIATQLPFVGMGVGAIGGAYAGSAVDSRITGIRVAGDEVKLSRGETRVSYKETTFAVGDAAAALAVFDTDEESTHQEPATDAEKAKAVKKAGVKKEQAEAA